MSLKTSDRDDFSRGVLELKSSGFYTNVFFSDQARKGPLADFFN